MYNEGVQTNFTFMPRKSSSTATPATPRKTRTRKTGTSRRKSTSKINTSTAQIKVAEVKEAPKAEVKKVDTPVKVRPSQPNLKVADYISDIKVRWQIHEFETQEQLIKDLYSDIEDSQGLINEINQDFKKLNKFGSTNGFDLSNSYLLEKDFGWKGILCEPASVWKEELKKNRNSILDFRCVWKTSGESLDLIIPSNPEYSKISILKNKKKFSVDQSEKVETVSLIDLLNTNNAPKNIDYLSIDTEGSEFDIIKNFDFKKRIINIISIEHNYHKNREKITLYQQLLIQ